MPCFSFFYFLGANRTLEKPLRSCLTTLTAIKPNTKTHTLQNLTRHKSQDMKIQKDDYNDTKVAVTKK